MADVTVKEQEAGSWSDLVTSLQAPSVTEYRTLSKNLAPTLTGIGGVMALIGSLGVWIRATETDIDGRVTEQVTAIMGFERGIGWIIAAVSVGVIALSAAWLSKKLVMKLAPVVAAGALSILAMPQLFSLTSEYRKMAQDAAQVAQNAAQSGIYHAGFGWGAWWLIVAVVVVLIGTVSGMLREVDLRRGYPG